MAKYHFACVKNRAKRIDCVVVVSELDSGAEPVGHDLVDDKLAPDVARRSEPCPTSLASELIRGRKDLRQLEASRDRHLSDHGRRRVEATRLPLAYK
jgi:hypothetical protein